MAKSIHNRGGIKVPLLTPLTEQHEIDENGVYRLVNHVIGPEERPYVDGIFVTGLTGEFPWLDSPRKKKMLEVTVDACGGRVPILFGSSGKTIEETIDLCIFGQKHGANELVVAPLYFWHTNRGLPEVMQIVAKSVGIPIKIYNNPFFAELGPRGSQRNIKTAIYKRMLKENPNIDGCKESSGDIIRFQNFEGASMVKPDTINYMGEERFMSLYPNCTPSWSNLNAKECRLLQTYVIDSDEQGRHHDMQNDINQAGEIVYCGKKKIRGGLKYALSLLGICGETVAEPGQELFPEEKVRIREFIGQNILYRS